MRYEYLQDGKDFYVKSGDDLIAVVCFPGRVQDGDIKAAQRAETWFLNLMELWRVDVTRVSCP